VARKTGVVGIPFCRHRKHRKEKTMTYTLRFTVALAVVIIVVIAFASSAVPTSPPPSTPLSKAAPVFTTGLAVPESENAAVALADMRSHAHHHFVVLKERPETFRTVEHYDAYELRWMEFEVAGGVIRVYHATNRDDSALRYTFLHDGRTAHDGWQPAN
jgi:hypothetical protein